MIKVLDRLPEAGARVARAVRLAKLSTPILLLGTAACAGNPPATPFAGADPADAAAPVRPVTDTGVLGAYTSTRPALPRSWREQNERVAPQGRP